MAIQYKTQMYVQQEELSNSLASEESIQRQMAHQLIKDMPIERLRKLIKFDKLDPFSIESEKRLLNKDVDEYEKQIIIHLRNMNDVRYEAYFIRDY